MIHCCGVRSVHAALVLAVSSLLSSAASAGGLCTDTKCGGAAARCCEGSPALQRKDVCVGSADCDACCGWVSKDVPFKAAAWIEALGLRKQPFGNFMTPTYDSELEVRGLPVTRFPGGTRSLSGDIYNLFAVNRSCNTSAQAGFPLHALAGDEIYHYYAGDGPLMLYRFDIENAVLHNISIGATTPGRDQPQYTIPGGTWTGALLAQGTTWALTGASTIPGFNPLDSHMAADNATVIAELRRVFPENVDLIDRLVSFR